MSAILNCDLAVIECSIPPASTGLEFLGQCRCKNGKFCAWKGREPMKNICPCPGGRMPTVEDFPHWKEPFKKEEVKKEEVKKEEVKKEEKVVE